MWAHGSLNETIGFGVEVWLLPGAEPTHTGAVMSSDLIGERVGPYSRCLEVATDSNLHKDFSGGPARADFPKAHEGHFYKIHSVKFVICDGAALPYNSFGAVAALTNGVRFVYRLGADHEEVDIPSGGALKANEDFFEDFEIEFIDDTAIYIMFAEWTPKQAFDMDADDPHSYIAVYLNDDLTGLTKFRITAQADLYRKT